MFRPNIIYARLRKVLVVLRKNVWKIGTIVISILFVLTQTMSIRVLPDARLMVARYQEKQLERAVTPNDGVMLPIQWGDLGVRLVETGVLNKERLENLYQERGGLDETIRRLLYATGVRTITINPQNANVLLNVFWALGLANKNPILETGPMVDKKYGGDASRFASTGGWSLADGDAMDHYSSHVLIALTKRQQALVEQVAKNIYRPCCGNSTYFPDCNHGMAMLGVLELAASQGADEALMYDMALVVNSYWFPSTYLTLAKYMESRGVAWKNVDAKTMLGYDYSSAGGYRGILAEMGPTRTTRSGGGSCGA